MLDWRLEISTVLAEMIQVLEVILALETERSYVSEAMLCCGVAIVVWSSLVIFIDGVGYIWVVEMVESFGFVVGCASVTLSVVGAAGLAELLEGSSVDSRAKILGVFTST